MELKLWKKWVNRHRISPRQCLLCKRGGRWLHKLLSSEVLWQHQVYKLEQLTDHTLILVGHKRVKFLQFDPKHQEISKAGWKKWTSLLQFFTRASNCNIVFSNCISIICTEHCLLFLPTKMRGDCRAVAFYELGFYSLSVPSASEVSLQVRLRCTVSLADTTIPSWGGSLLHVNKL